MAGASRWTLRHDDGKRGRVPADGQFSGITAGGLSRRAARSAGRAPSCSTGISNNVRTAAWLPAAMTRNAGDEAWNATHCTHGSPHAGTPASPSSEGTAPPWSQASAASAAAWHGADRMSAVTELRSRPPQHALGESCAILAPSAFADIRNATKRVNRRRKRAFTMCFVVGHELREIISQYRIAWVPNTAATDLDQRRRVAWPLGYRSSVACVDRRASVRPARPRARPSSRHPRAAAGGSETSFCQATAAAF